LAGVAHPRIVLLGRTRVDEAEPEACRGLEGEALIKQALVRKAKADALELSLAQIGAWAAHILAAREVRSLLADLDTLGSPALYRAADVRDPAAVARAVDDGRRAFGPITGLVHGAGVLADKLVEEKTAEGL